MIEQLPCSSCTGKCCGPVAIAPMRLPLIREHLRNMPRVERERLAKQKRRDIDCMFLDMADHHCTIYPVRPWVCEVFGRTEGMVCPQLGHLVQIMPNFLVEQGFAREGVVERAVVTNGLMECRSNEKPAGMSNEWDWETMEFA